MQQVFGYQHYNLARLHRYPEIELFIQSMAREGRRPLIVDAGANIGASSVYLSLAVPGSRVVAIEPDAGNFALLTDNVQGLEVRCLSAALAAQAGWTHLVDPGLGPWGYRTAADGSGPMVPTVTVAQVFQEHGGPSFYPFLVKVDIEGGEKDLFAANTDWVRHIPLLMVELHDWLLPRQGIALPFLRCVAGLERDFLNINENVYSIAYHFVSHGPS